MSRRYRIMKQFHKENGLKKLSFKEYKKCVKRYSRESKYLRYEHIYYICKYRKYGKGWLFMEHKKALRKLRFENMGYIDFWDNYKVKHILH